MEAVSTRARPITLVSGLGSRDKSVELAGLRPSQIKRRLCSAAGMERRS